MWKLGDITNILNDRIYILHDKHLHMKKLLMRWVPHLLTVDQKRSMNISKKYGHV